jgi:predicted  nucleic acid-binding Zn-ribbon protein
MMSSEERMTDDPDGLTLVLLRRLDAKMDGLLESLGELATRLRLAEQHVAALNQQCAALSERMARIETRLEGVERRLEDIEKRLPHAPR